MASVPKLGAEEACRLAFPVIVTLRFPCPLDTPNGFGAQGPVPVPSSCASPPPPPGCRLSRIRPQAARGTKVTAGPSQPPEQKHVLGLTSAGPGIVFTGSFQLARGQRTAPGVHPEIQPPGSIDLTG